MTLFHRLSRPSLLLVAGLGLLMASCSSKVAGNGGAITKVNPYHINTFTLSKPIADRGLSFERDYHLYGAITSQERADRYGDYYTIFWKVDERDEPVTVRLEYLKRLPSPQTHVIEKEITKVKRRNVTKFAITGKDFFTNGPVMAWRASLVRGKDVLATYNSYLWK